VFNRNYPENITLRQGTVRVIKYTSQCFSWSWS